MIRRISVVLLTAFIFLGCSKNTDEFIPEVFVDYQVTVVQFGIEAKNRVLLVPNRGVAGLMIVAKPGGGYIAFDRCSSVNPKAKCQVTPDDNGITATDPCTGAKYLLTDGSPQKAPAVRNLKVYNVRYNGTLINVTN